MTFNETNILCKCLNIYYTCSQCCAASCNHHGHSFNLLSEAFIYRKSVNQLCIACLYYLHKNGTAPSWITTIWKILISTSSGTFSPHLRSVEICPTNKLGSSFSLSQSLFSGLLLVRAVFFFLTWVVFSFPLVSFLFLAPFLGGVQAEPSYWEVELDMTRSMSSPCWTV